MLDRKKGSFMSTTAQHAQRASGARPATGRGLGHGAGFWVIAFALMVSTAFATVPSPLYGLYQRRDGFSSFMITVVFAAYAGGVVVSLFLAGHVSDRLGRRRIILPGLLLEVVSAVLFLAWPALPGLLVARVVSGLGIGLIAATATAHIGDLHAAARPGAARTRGDLVSTAANLGGLGVGPFVAGILAQFVSGPLTTPYYVFIALLLIAAVLVTLVPETVKPDVARGPYRPQRISVPDAHRSVYLGALAAGFASFAILGLFISLAPGFVAGTMHHPAHILSGTVALLAFGSAALLQTAVARFDSRRQLAIGFALLPFGLALVTAGVWLPSLAVFLIGGVVAGGAGGVLFKGTVGTVVCTAGHGAHGEALAGLLLAAYVGLAVPVLGIGIATQYTSTENSLLGFAVFEAVVAAAIARPMLRRRCAGRARPAADRIRVLNRLGRGSVYVFVYGGARSADMSAACRRRPVWFSSGRPVRPERRTNHHASAIQDHGGRRSPAHGKRHGRRRNRRERRHRHRTAHPGHLELRLRERRVRDRSR
jgi:MFS family permease